MIACSSFKDTTKSTAYRVVAFDEGLAVRQGVRNALLVGAQLLAVLLPGRRDRLRRLPLRRSQAGALAQLVLPRSGSAAASALRLPLCRQQDIMVLSRQC